MHSFASELHFEEDFNMQKKEAEDTQWVIASIDVKQRSSSFKSGLLIANFPLENGSL